MLNLLKDKNILITGASSGIGEACAKYFSQLGAKIILVARNKEKLEEVARQLSTETYIYPYDLLDIYNIKNIFMFCKEKNIKLNGLVHSAGILAECPIRANSIKLMEDAMKIHCFSFFEIGKYFYSKKYSEDGASIVAISSISSIICDKGMAPYSASKAALNATVKTMAKEFEKRKIRVNAILPAGVETPMTVHKRKIMGIDEENANNGQPYGVIEPENLAHFIGYLLSDDAKYITGSSFPISAGISY